MPFAGSGTLDFISHSVEQTTRVGARLGELLEPGDVICLAGNLGAGKTVLTKGIGQGWGILDTVTSPTFILIHEHRRAQDEQVMYHVDCYRLQNADDAWGIGLDDLLHRDGPVIIEWPEHVQDILPHDRLWITLDIVGDTQRRMVMIATGGRYQALVEALREVAAGP